LFLIGQSTIIGPGGLLLVPSSVLVFQFRDDGVRVSSIPKQTSLTATGINFLNSSQQAEKWRHPPKQTVFCSFDAGFVFSKRWGFSTKYFVFRKVCHLLRRFRQKEKKRKKKKTD
jgi:hypothetical protein